MVLPGISQNILLKPNK